MNNIIILTTLLTDNSGFNLATDCASDKKKYKFNFLDNSCGEERKKNEKELTINAMPDDRCTRR